MRHVCLIPARGGSKGIPGKNTKSFCGSPLIYWSIWQAINSEIFDDIYVSTDDSIIKDAVFYLGAKIIDRPSRLATDQSPMVPVIQHANSLMDADFITLLQPTNPLRFRSDIIGVADMIIAEPEETKNLVVCSVYPGSFYPVGGYSPVGGHRRQDDDKLYISGLIYCFSAESLYCWPAQTNVRTYEVKRWQAHEIDDPEDWDICEYLFQERILKDAETRNHSQLPST